MLQVMMRLEGPLLDNVCSRTVNCSAHDYSTLQVHARPYRDYAAVAEHFDILDLPL